MTDDSGRPRRRAVLAALAGGVATSLAGCSGESPSPTPSSSPTATDPPGSPTTTPTGTDTSVASLRTRASGVFYLYAIGAFEDARAYYGDQLDEDLSTEQLRGGWDAWTAEAGRFEGVAGTVHRTNEGYDIVHVIGAFESGLVAVDYAFGADGQILGLVHNKPRTGQYSTPDYVSSEALSERTVTVAGGACDLPAVRTLPAGSETVPGVVLVGDDGPRDRNGTVGPNRPLQDLAWGLADRGVASLRYDSRALACGTLAPEATTLDGLANDASAAVERLRASDRVGPAAVVGHGLGGWVAARVAGGAEVSGMAALATPARPLTTTRPAAARHVANVDGTVEDTERRWVDHVASEAERVPDLAADEVALGATGAFWRSVEGYDPVTETGGLSVPTRLVFGGRDFEVTQTDRERWADAGEVRVVEAANHLLQPGEGPAKPGEYALPNTVAESVVGEVAGFVNGL